MTGKILTEADLKTKTADELAALVLDLQARVAEEQARSKPLLLAGNDLSLVVTAAANHLQDRVDTGAGETMTVWTDDDRAAGDDLLEAANQIRRLVTHQVTADEAQSWCTGRQEENAKRAGRKGKRRERALAEAADHAEWRGDIERALILTKKALDRPVTDLAEFLATPEGQAVNSARVRVGLKEIEIGGSALGGFLR